MTTNKLWTAGFSIVVFCSPYTAALASSEPTSEAYFQERMIRTDIPADGGYKQERMIRTDMFELWMFPGWFKPLCDVKSFKGSSRLVVKLTADGSALLNPEGEGAWSSDTVSLKDLTFSDAKVIWGAPRGFIFDLLAPPRAGSNDWDVFHLDTKFADDGVLSSYRLRGINICSPRWVNVQ